MKPMERALSAPSKLFVSGEYAVLWGGIARVLAVGPRVGACVRGRADRRVQIAHASGSLRGTATPQGVRWEDEVPDALRFAARTADFAYRAHGREALGLSVALEPSPVGEGGHKLGLGGSARTCVLVAEACRFVLQAAFDPLKLALLAHAQTQGGKGSGADVAAIYAGGFVRYRRYPVEGLTKSSAVGALGGELAAAAPVDLLRLVSPAVPLAYVFDGASAHTPSWIARVEARLDTSARERFVWRSDVAGDGLEQALIRGDFPAVKEALELHRGLLGELGPLETEAAQQALALARTYGCAGKTSGAGGGDGLLVAAPDLDARASLLEALRARGFLTQPLELQVGLRAEEVKPSAAWGWLDER